MRIRSLLFTLSVFILIMSCQTEKEKLPIYGEREAVETENGTDTLYHTIGSFELLNQDSATVSDKDFDDKIYIADFFFTNCPTICPTTQRNLLSVYKEFKNDDRIAFLSHSVDFKYDSPSVLKAYAKNLGVEGTQWQFLSGTKSEIYGLSDDYLVFVEEDENAPGGYEHQGYFVLVDKEKRIRGAYDGTDMLQVKKLIKDIPLLLDEYK